MKHFRISSAYPSGRRYPSRRQIVHVPGCRLVKGDYEWADASAALGALLAPSHYQVRLCRVCRPAGAQTVPLNDRMRDHGWDDAVQDDLRAALAAR